MFYINIFQGTLMSGSITYQSFGEINYIEQHKNLEHEHLLCGLNFMFFSRSIFLQKDYLWFVLRII